MENNLRYETERAWGLPEGKLRDVWKWVSDNVPKERQGKALVSVMRQMKERDMKPKPSVPKLPKNSPLTAKVPCLFCGLRLSPSDKLEHNCWSKGMEIR